jgi:hypothetical protein
MTPQRTVEETGVLRVEHHFRFTAPKLPHDILDLFVQRALPLAVVGRVARDEFLDHGAQRGGLERGVGDLNCRAKAYRPRTSALSRPPIWGSNSMPIHTPARPVPQEIAGRRGGASRADQNRNRPQRWSQRYEIILRRHLAGWRTTEIAAELRYSPHRVSMIVSSPLFRERKAALLRELTGDARAAFLDEIRREAIPNFEFLRAVRDDATLETRVRVRAAQAIADQLDRLLPRDGRG